MGLYDAFAHTVPAAFMRSWLKAKADAGKPLLWPDGTPIAAEHFTDRSFLKRQECLTYEKQARREAAKARRQKHAAQ